MSKMKLPESVRKQFAAAGRKGGLAGSRAAKKRAGKAGGLKTAAVRAASKNGKNESANKS